MASVGWEGDRARILFRDEQGKQQTIRLGKCPKDYARSAKMAIGHLVIAKRHNGVPHPDAVRWLGGIDEVLYTRVAAHGLCQPRAEAEVVTLGTLLDRFEKSASVKEGTRTNYRQALAMLRSRIDESTPIQSITPHMADEWRRSMNESGLASATIAKRVKVAKAVFTKAVKWGLLESSPFADLKAGSQSNADRAFYVPRDSIAAVLEACPDDEWRAIVGLVRFAGLRCPSELKLLRWGDVSWDKRRLVVRSPKTAGHEGHDTRVVPIDPELYPILQNLFDRAEVGVEAVVPRVQSAKQNLRTQFERIIGKAGLKPWPRLFHNLRSSCATDWVERFPNHIVAKWLGHSPMIAATHYLQTRDAHFDLAAGIGKGGDSCQIATAANPATLARTSRTAASQKKIGANRQGAENPTNQGELVVCGIGHDAAEKEKTHDESWAMTPAGIEPAPQP